MNVLVLVVSCVLGSGGISAFITALLSSRKYKAEAKRIEEEAAQIRSQSGMSEIDFISKQLRDFAEISRNEIDELVKRNSEMRDRIERMNDQLQSLMQWIIYDNQSYRKWLEDELRKLTPDIVFPECPPPPCIFK